MIPLPYRALALDLDGTLLNPEGRVSPAAGRALRNLSAQGLKIALASGRMTDRVVPYAEEIGVPMAVISYNGAEIHEKASGLWKPIYSRFISERTRSEVLRFCDRRGLFLNVYARGKLYGYHPGGDFAWSRHYSEQTGAGYALLSTRTEDMPVEGIAKMLLIDTPGNRDRLYGELSRPFSSHCQVTKSNPEYIEFVDLGISKGSALESWLGGLGLGRHQLIAFGDAENDLEMLTLAGMGIAMGNCTPGLRALYGRVSQWTHDQDGVAHALAAIFPGLAIN